MDDVPRNNHEDDEDDLEHDGGSSRTNALVPSNRHQSSRAPPAASAAPVARTHGHHLRDRSAISRNRSGSSGRDDDGDERDRRSAAYSSRGGIGRVPGGRGGDDAREGGDVGGVMRRRNRPRSVSMPEGMELQASRVRNFSSQGVVG